MLKRFRERSGIAIEEIIGQNRLAYSLSSHLDFYDLEGWPENEVCPGSLLTFYDLQDGSVYKPLAQKEDVICGKPHFFEKHYYFLTADRQKKEVTLYRYHPEEALQAIRVFPMKEVELYNLQIMGEGIHVVSQNGSTFQCYDPESFSFAIDPHDTAVFISEGKVYLERWIEEGWDEENNCATADYRFYHKIITRDFKGNTLSEELGYLYQSHDGTWWIG